MLPSLLYSWGSVLQYVRSWWQWREVRSALLSTSPSGPGQLGQSWGGGTPPLVKAVLVIVVETVLLGFAAEVAVGQTRANAHSLDQFWLMCQFLEDEPGASFQALL